MKEKTDAIDRGPWKRWSSTIEDCIDIFGLPPDVLLKVWVHGFLGITVPHVPCCCHSLGKVHSRRHDDAGNMNLVLGSTAENEDLTGIEKMVVCLNADILCGSSVSLGNVGGDNV